MGEKNSKGGKYLLGLLIVIVLLFAVDFAFSNNRIVRYKVLSSEAPNYPKNLKTNLVVISEFNAHKDKKETLKNTLAIAFPGDYVIKIEKRGFFTGFIYSSRYYAINTGTWDSVDLDKKRMQTQ